MSDTLKIVLVALGYRCAKIAEEVK